MVIYVGGVEHTVILGNYLFLRLSNSKIPNFLLFILIFCTLWTVNDVTGKDPLPRGVFTASVVAFHLERPLKSWKLKFEGSFHLKCPKRSFKYLSRSFQGIFSCDIIDSPYCSFDLNLPCPNEFT